MRPTETSAMLQVDLSTLRGPELRQLLDATRRRGQAKLSYEILQEMAARRERGGQPSTEPRLVGLDLGDPLEREDEDAFAGDAPLEAAQAEGVVAGGAEEAEQPPPEPEDMAPLRLEREPRRAPRSKVKPARPPRPTRAPPPPRPAQSGGVWGRRVRWTILGLLAGAGAGYAFGFWVGTDGRAPPAPAPAAAAPAVQVATIAPPAAAPVAEAVPAPPQAAPETPAETPAASLTAPPAAEAAPTPAPPPAPAVPEPAAKAAKADEVVAAAPPVAKACAGQSAPADRTICGDERLKRLQKALRTAYAEALAAHEDKALLRERQLAWADARDGVTDPERLARLYEARIRKLNAATAEALAAR